MTEAEPGNWAEALSFAPLLIPQQVVELVFFNHACVAGEDGLAACVLQNAMFWNDLLWNKQVYM